MWNTALLLWADAEPPPYPMWQPTVHWAELILRALLVYVFLLVVLRLTGKRQIGQLAPFDLVLLLVLSNAVQNAMNGGDNSYTAGVVSAGTLVLVNYLVGVGTYKFKWLETLVEGRPTVLIHNGQLDERAMRREKMTRHELMAALREAGCTSIDQVHFAALENNGRLTVLPFHKDKSETIHGLHPPGQETKERPPLPPPS